MRVYKERIFKDVEYLTTLNPPRNYKNLDSIEKAATYIENEFKRIDLKVENQYFIAEKNTYRNVIASYNINKKERFVVGAHYDVFGQFPGADDNASAVAGLLETARLISEQKPKLNYRIDFVAFCLEEPPFFGSAKMGSAIHSKFLKEKNVKILGMLCYEMIGYFSDEKDSQAYPLPEFENLYPSIGNFIIVVGKSGQEKFAEKIKDEIQNNCAVKTILIINSDIEDILSMSDHYNYWDLGYNAIMINDTSFLRNPNYHQATDTIETLDFDKMAEVIYGFYQNKRWLICF